MICWETDSHDSWIGHWASVYSAIRELKLTMPSRLSRKIPDQIFDRAHRINRTCERESSPASIHRIWHAHGLQPHRVRTFKLSTDPRFVEKLTDVVGLYVDPPDKPRLIAGLRPPRRTDAADPSDDSTTARGQG